MITRRQFAAAAACTLLGSATLLPAANVERVDFRLMKWKTLHFEDAGSAQKYYKTFKAIGCECEQEKHNGHIDVRFRCTEWRSLTLKTHAEAHRWEAFLKKAGFETRHEH